MITTELTGEPVAAWDKDITEFIASEECDGDGKPMVLAVENEHNTVYRVIKVTDFVTYEDIAGFLWDIGLEDILEGSPKPVDGFDARFRFGHSE